MIDIFFRKYDVITFGSASIDTFITINKKYKDVKKGDKIIIKETFTETGGAALNAAITLANFGYKVKIISKIGKDHNGFVISHKIKDKKITFHKIISRTQMTPFSVILNSNKEDDRIVYAYKGAADSLGENDFHLNELNTSWLYLGSFVGKSFKVAEKVAEYAKAHKIKVLFNPSTYMAAKGRRGLMKILNATSILILNKEEAELVYGKKSSIRELLIGLKGIGPEIVIISDGKNKLYAIDSKCTYSAVPYKVKIVSTLGSGDAFSSGFLASYLKNKDIQTSIKVGLANAASVVQKYGATSDVLSYRQAINFIKKHKTKLDEYCELKW